MPRLPALAIALAGFASALPAAARAGNLDAIKAAMGAVGGSCKACHDDFRAERYSN